MPQLALRPQSPRSSDEQAAAPDPQKEVLLREVDDALREDQMLGALRRYGKPVGALIVAGLLALGGYLWWDHARTQDLGEQGEKLVIALDRIEAGHLDSAKSELAAVSGGEGGAAISAKLLEAGIALEQGRTADAVKAYALVADDADAPQPLRDLATIRQVAIGFDAMKPEQVIERLKPLAVPGNPWFGSAGELVGLAYVKQGRGDLAGPLFAAISRDKDAPESLKRRARQMAGVLGVDAIDDVAGAAAGDAAPESGAAVAGAAPQ